MERAPINHPRSAPQAFPIPHKRTLKTWFSMTAFGQLRTAAEHENPRRSWAVSKAIRLTLACPIELIQSAQHRPPKWQPGQGPGWEHPSRPWCYVFHTDGNMKTASV